MQWWSADSLSELGSLLLAFALGACIGFERHRRLKSAGLRTHAVVGVGSAAFTLVSAHGFSNVLGADVGLDPSRIAAQIVSGIGFLGAGVIFVRGDGVRGLTTAASVWLSAAVGMACGAALPVVALGATALYLVAVTGLTSIARLVTPEARTTTVLVRYRVGKGVLRTALELAVEHGFRASLESSRVLERSGHKDRVEARLQVSGTNGDAGDLVAVFAEIPGMSSVRLVAEDV
ncbi:membrane protein [Luteimicrobium album]|uniref:Membrane protein n=1 Tax=Luteimicrobium album TaxID=1054550 RepID=A0ABQ6I1E3_9MICO|nr:MgtC/SapB family protein [Luteimicrobium album]GMA23595.1 membrane protein [Luteimicrobium album]